MVASIPSGLFPVKINLNLTKDEKTPLTGDQPAARLLPAQDNTDTEKMQTYIRTWSGIRTHDPSFRAGRDS
jgi:hypothetical protein